MDQQWTMDQQDQLINQGQTGLDNLEFPYVLEAYFYETVNNIIWDGKSNGVLFGQGYKNILFLHPNHMKKHLIAINEATFQKSPNLNTSESADFKMKQTRTFQIEGTCEFLKDNQWFVSIGKPLSENPTKNELEQMLWVSKVNPSMFIRVNEAEILEAELKNEELPEIITRQLTTFELSDQGQFSNESGNFIELIYLNKDIKLAELKLSELNTIELTAPKDTLFNYISSYINNDGNNKQYYFNLDSPNIAFWPFRLEPIRVDKHLNIFLPWQNKFHIPSRIINYLAEVKDITSLFATTQPNTTIEIKNGQLLNVNFKAYELSNIINGNITWNDYRNIFNTIEKTPSNTAIISDYFYVMGHRLNDDLIGNRTHSKLFFHYSDIPDLVSYIDSNGVNKNILNATILNAKMRVIIRLVSNKEEIFNDLIDCGNDKNNYISIDTEINNGSCNIKIQNNKGYFNNVFSQIGGYPEKEVLFICESTQFIIKFGVTGDNPIAEFIKALVSINDMALSGFPSAKYDQNRNPINNMAVIKEFVRDHENITNASNALIDKFIQLYINNPNFDTGDIFNSIWVNAISFINSLNNRINSKFNVKDFDNDIYNALNIKLQNFSQFDKPTSMLKSLINGLTFEDNSTLIQKDLNSILYSLYFKWTVKNGFIDDFYSNKYLTNGNEEIESFLSSKIYKFKEISNNLDEKLLDYTPEKIDINKEEYQKYLFWWPYDTSNKNNLFILIGIFGNTYLKLYDRVNWFNNFVNLLPKNPYPLRLKINDIKDKINILEISGIWGGKIIINLIFKYDNKDIKIPIETTLFNINDESVCKTNYIF